MDDLISRQAAIDAIDEISREVDDGYGFDYEKWREYFCELPSAQPEPCEDAVPREAVKEIAYGQIRGEYSGIALKEQRETMFRLADSIIRVLPSVTPKQRTGHWILDRSGAYCCSECMEPCAGYVMMKPRDKFCKMCGAKMEVTE